MKIRIFCAMMSLLGVCLSASASLTPVGSYDLTFSREGWTETRTIPVTTFPGSAPFYQVGGKDVNVYLEQVANPDSKTYAFTWYVNAPAVLDDPACNTLLSGTGPLTITVSGLKFAETSDVTFQPFVTHIYYVGYSDGYFQKQYIPGATNVDPGQDQFQRSPILPLMAADADFNAYGPSYGTPYEDITADDATFVLPSLFVPNGANWELSFGAGFTASPNVPEPASLLILGLGWFGLRRKF